MVSSRKRGPCGPSGSPRISQNIPQKTNRYLMSKYDAAELWRQSLNNVNIILRGSKNGFPQKRIDEYSFWADTYYRLYMAFSGEVTLYKVKLLLNPKLVEAGCIRSPWDHRTEAMEHSNHRAHQLYHQKTCEVEVNCFMWIIYFKTSFYRFFDVMYKASNKLLLTSVWYSCVVNSGRFQPSIWITYGYAGIRIKRGLLKSMKLVKKIRFFEACVSPCSENFEKLN